MANAQPSGSQSRNGFVVNRRLRQRILALALLPSILVLFARCGGDNPAAPDSDPPPSDPPPSDNITKTIDQTGGVITLDDEAWVHVPAGALDGPLEITISRVPNAPNPPANHHSRAAGYSFTPHGQAFNVPVTMGVTFALSNLRVLPSRDAAAYDTTWAFLVPLAIPLLLFRVAR